MDSDQKRCYVCNRSGEDVLALFSSKQKGSSTEVVKMTGYTYSPKVECDEEGTTVYKVTSRSGLKMKDIHEYVSDEKILNWFRVLIESEDRDGVDYNIYSYSDCSPHWKNKHLFDYLKEGGKLIDDSKVHKFSKLQYYLCSICENAIKYLLDAIYNSR